MDKNLANCFLIASPSMKDPNFEKTVIFIAEHNPHHGAMGIVINREGSFMLSSACEQLHIDMPEDFGDFTFGWGGPVRPNSGFIFTSLERDWPATFYRSEELNFAISVSPDILRGLVLNEGPEKLYITLGCAGWDPGQLEKELESDAWYVIPADAHLIFDVPVQQRYERALAYVGLDKVSISAFLTSEVVGHA